jgi:redox-sensitive bicupin YhaK (pirin superfamily)
MQIRRATQRFRTKGDGIDGWHCFSYADQYDPENVRFALLVAHNEFTLQPDAGFAPHRHSEMEIVTWLLDGELSHRDGAGHRAILRPGQAQRMTAGSGLLHAETNDSDRTTRFVQMWVTPDEPGHPPSYDRHDFTASLGNGGLVAIASGHYGAPLRIRQRGAALRVARLRPGRRVELPQAPYLHLYVARGDLILDAEPLHEGDEARIDDGAAHAITARHAAEVLVWEMHATA